VLAEKFIKSAVIYLIIGLLLGLYMAMTQDHSQIPAHAHLNLLGWVTMALMGLVYKSWPPISVTKIAALTYWLSHISVIGLTIGIGLIYAGYPEYEPIAAISSIAVLMNVVLFAFLVHRNI
jgi:hypothetical protein|tara:strand:+ start:366 stop:728 length:363 start_codon:yes stop_codon:yes gene_type:complete